MKAAVECVKSSPHYMLQVERLQLPDAFGLIFSLLNSGSKIIIFSLSVHIRFMEFQLLLDQSTG